MVKEKNVAEEPVYLTRQQLQELEERNKTNVQKIMEYVISILPLLTGLLAVMEYLLVPNSIQNPNPYTYLVFLLILETMYLGFWIRSMILNFKGNRQPFRKIRYKAPLYAVLFLLFLIYDYLTLKTGFLTQPFVPCINSIMNIAWIDREMLIISTLHTLRLLLLGYFIGVILGLITGITCGYSKKVKYWIDPLIKFLGPIPSSTWIPIMMVIVGGALFAGSIFIIALGSWFAVTVASMTGISNVDNSYFEAARTLGATERQMIFRVAIPHAMPSILQGMTQAMSTACTAIMIAEMMGVKAGLGWYMTWAKSWASFDKMYAALFVICIIFTIVTKVLNLIKKYALRWQIGVVK